MLITDQPPGDTSIEGKVFEELDIYIIFNGTMAYLNKNSNFNVYPFFIKLLPIFSFCHVVVSHNDYYSMFHHNLLKRLISPMEILIYLFILLSCILLLIVLSLL